MIVDQDIVQRIKVAGIFGLQFYKVLTGTMLTLFIPQACYVEELTNGTEVITIKGNFKSVPSRKITKIMKSIIRLLCIGMDFLSFCL